LQNFVPVEFDHTVMQAASKSYMTTWASKCSQHSTYWSPTVKLYEG